LFRDAPKPNTREQLIAIRGKLPHGQIKREYGQGGLTKTDLRYQPP